MGANTAGYFIYLAPVFGTVAAIVLLGESFFWFHALGIALIFAGIFLATLGPAGGAGVPDAMKGAPVTAGWHDSVLSHYPVGETGGIAYELERSVEVEVVIDRVEMGERRRLGEKLEGQPMPGMV